jgi:hypothetical protein
MSKFFVRTDFYISKDNFKQSSAAQSQELCQHSVHAMLATKVPLQRLVTLFLCTIDCRV